MANLTASIIRILSKSGETVGTGFVLSDTLAVTCAHVVAAAGSEPGGSVRFAFHATRDEAAATVEPDGWRDSTAEDIAILRLPVALPAGVEPLPLGLAKLSDGHHFRAFGFPQFEKIQGVWASGEILGHIEDSNGITMLQLRSQEIKEGMSGAPLLDIEQQRVVGIVNAAYYPPDRSPKFEHAAFAIPIETLRSVWPGAANFFQPDPLTQKLNRYREYILEKTRYVTMKGVPLPPGVGQVPLDRVYIHLQAADQKTLEHQRESEQQARIEARKKKEEKNTDLPESVLLQQLLVELFSRQRDAYRTNERSQPVSPAKALKEHRRLVILGAPGAGKTTLLLWLARQAALQDNGALPILVSARDFSTALIQKPTLKLREFAFESIIDDTLVEAVRQANEAGQVLWLVDALDEARGDYGRKIVEQTQQLKGQVIVTSRPFGYPGGLPEDQFKTFEVLPLIQDDIDHFIADWFALLADGEPDPAQQAWLKSRQQWLKDTIAQHVHLQPLIKNPLLLTFLVILSSEKGRQSLPENRSALYQNYIDKLINNWERYREAEKKDGGEPILTLRDPTTGTLLSGQAAIDAILQGFIYLGWRLHLLYFGGRIDHLPKLDHLTQMLANHLSRHCNEIIQHQDDHQVARAVINFWQEAGMLDTWTTANQATFYAFRHLTFQEYAAALYLFEAWRANSQTTWKWIKPRLHIPTWREPLLLMSSKLPEAKREALLNRILKARSPYERTLGRDLRLAAAIIGEREEVAEKLVQQVIGRLGKLTGNYTVAQQLILILIFLAGLIVIGRVAFFAGSFLGLTIVSLLWVATWTIGYAGLLPSSWSVFAFPTRLCLTPPDSSSFIESLGKTGRGEAFPYLKIALQSKNEGSQTVVAEAIGKLGVKAVKPLIEFLKDCYDEEEQTLRDVVEDISEVSRSIFSKQTLNQLIKARVNNRRVMVDIWANVKTSLSELKGFRLRTIARGLRYTRDIEDLERATVEALSQPEMSPAIPSLIKRLCNQEEMIEIRLIIAEVLGKVKNKAAVDCFLDLLQEQYDDRLRILVITLLGQIGDKRAIPPLKKIIDVRHGDYAICQSAAEALGRLGDENGINHLIADITNKNEYSGFNWWIGGKPREFVREQAAEALGRLEATQAVPHLVNRFHGTRKYEPIKERRAIVKALGQIGGKEAVKALVEIMRYSDVASDAAGALSKVQADPLTIDYLTEIIDKGAYYSAYGSGEDAIFGLLGDKRNKHVIPLLIELLNKLAKNNYPPESTYPIIRTLGQIGDSKVEATLIDVLRNRNNNTLRSVTIVALGRIGGTEAIPSLAAIVDDAKNPSWIKQKVIQTLEQIGSEESISIVKSSLHHQEFYIRLQAAKVLAPLGNEPAILFLTKTLRDNHLFFRLDRQTLDYFGGKFEIWAKAKKIREVYAEIILSLSHAASRVENRKILNLIANAAWWRLTDRDIQVTSNSWMALNYAVQQLTIVEARQLPATDISLQPQQSFSRWRTGLGAFMATLGLLLIGLGQDIVGNLLAEQIGTYIPFSWQILLLLAGLALMLGGLALFWSRWQTDTSTVQTGETHDLDG